MADEETPEPQAQMYAARITGPGIDSSVAITDEADVDIIDAMLKKIRQALQASAAQGI